MTTTRRKHKRPLRLLARADIAEVLGVSPRRVGALTERQDWPVAYAEDGNGRRLWLRADVTRWAKRWDRRVGRPPVKS